MSPLPTADATPARPVVSRRALLFGAVTLASAPALAGCGLLDEQPPPPDPLEELRGSALSDVALAESIAQGFAELKSNAEQLAKDRRAHAEALETELNRARPSRTTGALPPSPAPAPRPPNQKAASTALARAMLAAQEQAAALVPTLPRHRAALVGSISACCAGLREVLT